MALDADTRKPTEHKHTRNTQTHTPDHTKRTPTYMRRKGFKGTVRDRGRKNRTRTRVVLTLHVVDFVNMGLKSTGTINPKKFSCNTM